MFTNRLSDPLKKHIYRFLVESNLDLIDPNYRQPILDYSHPFHSTLSIIRQINKDSKRITQDWQDKFKDFLQPRLAENSNLKKFYMSINYNVFSYQRRRKFIVDSLLNPIFIRMQGTVDEKIAILKSVLDECNNWKESSNCAKLESSSEKTKYELREIYINLNQIPKSLLYVSDFDSLHLQYQYLIIEKITKLLFKQNYNFSKNQKEEKIFCKKPILKNNKYPYFGIYKAQRNFQSNSIYCLWIACILPLTLTAVIGGLLMEDGQGRDALLGTTISFSILAALISFCFCATLRDNIRMQQGFLNFRARVFDDIENQYEALNDNEHKTDASRLDASVESKKSANDLIINIPDDDVTDEKDRLFTSSK